MKNKSNKQPDHSVVLTTNRHAPDRIKGAVLPFVLYLAAGLIIGGVFGPFMIVFFSPVGIVGPVVVLVAAFVAIRRSRAAAGMALAGAVLSWLAISPMLGDLFRGHLDRRLVGTQLLLIVVTVYPAVALVLKPRSTLGTWVFPQRNGANDKLLVIAACSVIGIVAAIVVVAEVEYGTHTIRVDEKMTWECAPEKNVSWAPRAQAVRFRYVEDPHYEEVVSGRGLCDQLRASGKPIVTVQYEAWGNRRNGLVGFREVSVDGKPIVDVGGWGSSGARDPVGPHPLRKLFK